MLLTTMAIRGFKSDAWQSKIREIEELKTVFCIQGERVEKGRGIETVRQRASSDEDISGRQSPGEPSGLRMDDSASCTPYAVSLFS